MSYLAYLCYRNSYDDDNELIDEAVVIEFEQPPSWRYAKVVPIQFSPLHSWTDKDKDLYKC